MNILDKLFFCVQQAKTLLYYNPLMKMIFRAKGVKIGRNPRFYGFAYVQKHQESTIGIGNNCTFRNKMTSNPHGIYHKCMITTLGKGAKVEIGDNCGFSGVSLFCASSITICDNVKGGVNVEISDCNGHMDDYRSGDSLPIRIEDNVWIGSNVTIMKGVTISRFAMVGVGAVVRNSIPPYAIVIGNPAKITGFSMTPDEIVEYEKTIYSVEKRLPIDLLEKNYEKYFLKRIKEIKEYTKL